MPETSGVQAPDGVHSLITADEAAALCKVTAIAVRHWANRGYVGLDGERTKLPVAGTDRTGRRLYRMLDVAKAERATRGRSGRRSARG